MKSINDPAYICQHENNFSNNKEKEMKLIEKLKDDITNFLYQPNKRFDIGYGAINVVKYLSDELKSNHYITHLNLTRNSLGRFHDLT